MKSAVIIGAIIAGCFTFAGVLAANWLNMENGKRAHERSVAENRRNELVSKIEELHTLFQKWELDFIGLYLVTIPVYKGEYGLEKAKEISEQDRLQEKGEHQRFQTLMNLYFPTLAEEFVKVDEARTTVYGYCSIHADFDKKNLSDFYKAQKRFEEQANKFKEVIAEQARKL